MPRSRGANIARALGWSLLYFLAGILLSLAVAFPLAFLLGPPVRPLTVLDQPGPTPLIIQGWAALVGFGLATWLVGVKGAGLTAADLRWKVTMPRLESFGLGLAIGVVPAGLALGLAVIGGGAGVVPDAGTGTEYLWKILLTGLVLAPLALSEEIMFRGVPQVLLSRWFGRAVTLVVMSGLFALAHIANPGVSSLALSNIALAGVFLGAAFYLPGGIWTAFGAHLAWNATLAAADAPVSGLPFTIPWISWRPGEPTWLTGGAFGPEGGVVATVAVAIALGWIVRRIRREAA